MRNPLIEAMERNREMVNTVYEGITKSKDYEHLAYARVTRTDLTTDWLHQDMRVQDADQTDLQIANRVRMLMRDQLDHESVCTAARDRIMCLSKEVSRLRKLLEPFAVVADAEKGKPAYESVFVNVDRCRDARKGLTIGVK